MRRDRRLTRPSATASRSDPAAAQADEGCGLLAALRQPEADGNVHRRPAPHECPDGAEQQRYSAVGSPSTLTPSEGWSLEHIHAQHSQALTKENERRDWLDAHVKKIRATSWKSELKAEADASSRRWTRTSRSLSNNTDDTGFQEYSRQGIRSVRSAGLRLDGQDVHGLGNLVLLQRDFNSKLNNAVFALKRERILELDGVGAYILPCTRNVFLKYYTASADQQLSIWSPQDQDNYYDSSSRLSSDFLLPDPRCRGGGGGMKGYPTTFLGLFDPPHGERPAITEIEIPIIQRDFAQGRPDDDTSAIRERFLDASSTRPRQTTAWGSTSSTATSRTASFVRSTDSSG